MLTAGTDFQCSEKNKVYVCVANTQPSLQLYKALQTRIRQVAVEMAKVRPDVPPDLVTIEPDGRIGPTTAIGVQTVLAVLNRTVPLPMDLFPILSIQATSQETIARIASLADATLQYIDSTLINYPDAFKMPVTIQTVKVPWWPPKAWTLMDKRRVVAAGGLVVVATGIGLAAWKLNRKRKVNEVELPGSDDDASDE
jgi:hypothetical protein